MAPTLAYFLYLALQKINHCVQIESTKSIDLTIETSTPVSSLGMVTLPPT